MENRENAKFCKECGENLEFACSGCGTVYDLGSKFCDECGYSLAQGSQSGKTQATSDGERKHVTVLFSDLSGYTAMSEKLDPEEVKEITSLIFDDVSLYEFINDAVAFLSLLKTSSWLESSWDIRNVSWDHVFLILLTI